MAVSSPINFLAAVCLKLHAKPENNPVVKVEAKCCQNEWRMCILTADVSTWESPFRQEILGSLETMEADTLKLWSVVN